jgi:hypothetical protein
MSAATVVQWEDPPPAGHRRGRRKQVNHGEIAETLRARPGEWAVIPVATTGLAGQIARGDLRAYRPARSFQAVRRDADGEIRIYVRFVGQAESVSS